MPKSSALFLFFCLLTSSRQLSAQDNAIDSLTAITESKASDKQRLEAFIQLTEKLGLSNFNATQNAAEKGLALAAKLKDSVSYAVLSKQLGIAHYFEGDYEKAAIFYYRAAGIFERFQKTKELAHTTNDLAKLYRKTRDLKRAAALYEKAYSLFSNSNDSSGMQMILNESGVVYEYEGNYEEAIRRYHASMQLAQLLKDDAGRGWSMSFIAGVYVLQNKFPEAENFLKQTLAIRQQLNDSFALALSYSDLGVLYNKWNRHEQAIQYLQLSNRLAEKMGYRELQLNNYIELSSVAKASGNYKEAYQYYNRHVQLKDSLFASEKTKQIEELATKYETKQKEQQIEVQQLTIRKRNIQLMFALFTTILIIILAYLFYNRYKWKQKLLLQKEILRQQEITTKQILEAEEKERQRIAKDLHDGVGQMMSAAKMNLSAFENDIQFSSESQKLSFDRIISMVDESCKEVRAASHQMMPNVLLKSGLASAVSDFIDKIDERKLRITLHTEGLNERLEENTEVTLYRIIQESVHNVIKHAQASTLDISLMKDAEGISVSIEDNGKGFDTKQVNKDEGLGLKNMQARTEFLKGTIDIDSSPGRGTLIAIFLPIK